MAAEGPVGGGRLEVTVRCYGPAERAAGAREVVVVIAVGATVAELLAELAAHADSGPGLAPILDRCAVGIGDDLVGRAHVLAAGEAEIVSLLPPVAGGG